MGHEQDTEDLRRRLGTAGENCLRALAVNFYVTRPEQDYAGWDFLIQEVNSKSSSFGPHSSGKLKAWIQVKTIAGVAGRKSVPRIQVKLSNWKKALESDPWFFLVVEANEHCRAQRAWLVHVSETWIDNVVRRILEDEDKVHPSDDPKLELTWEATDELPSITDAEAFEARVRTAIGGDLDSYRLAKRLRRDKAGFERFDIAGTVELPAEDSEVQLIRHFLGFSQLSADVRHLRERRFDKDRVKHTLGAGGLPTSWEPITLSLAGACKPIALQGRLYRTEQIKRLTTADGELAFSDHVIASRLDAPPLDLISLMGEWHLRLSAVDSSELVNICRAATAYDIHVAINRVYKSQNFIPIKVEPRELEKVNLDLGGVGPELASAVAEVGRGQEMLRHLALALALNDSPKDERVTAFALKAQFPPWKYIVAEEGEHHIWHTARIVRDVLLAVGVDNAEALTCHYDDLLKQTNEIFILGILANCTGKNGVVLRFKLQAPFPLGKDMRVPVVVPVTIGDHHILAAGFLCGVLSHEPEIESSAYCLRCDTGDLAWLKVASSSQLGQAEIDWAREALDKMGSFHAPGPSLESDSGSKVPAELGRKLVKQSFSLASCPQESVVEVSGANEEQDVAGPTGPAELGDEMAKKMLDGLATPPGK